MAVEHPPTWSALSRPIAGFGYGCRSPLLLVEISGGDIAFASVDRLFALLVERRLADDPATVQRPDGSAHVDGFAACVDLLLQTVLQWQQAVDLPVNQRGRVISRQAFQVRLAIPTIGRGMQAVNAAVLWLLELVNRCLQQRAADDHLDQAGQIRQQLAANAPGSANVPHLVRAAYQSGIPVTEVSGRVIQYGYGARSRWLDSSFSDQTGVISVGIARNKEQSAQVLARYGIPAAQQKRVGNEQEALTAARQLGYPVVVKPAALDGGVGVAADLRSEAELQAAYRQTRKESADILIEKHFSGRDYRLSVVLGEVVWINERQPAGVTGDGEHSVQELVDQLNGDPRRGEHLHARLKRVALNDEALSLLHRQGLDACAIPPRDQFIQLRRNANLASGGIARPIDPRMAHPDNIALAIRAADAMRLDIAGVDLLIEDIHQSWRQTGALVCEVNGQPQLGQNAERVIYAPVLHKLVKGNGRIPIVVLLGVATGSPVFAGLEQALMASGFVPGIFDGRCVRVNGVNTIDATRFHAAGTALLMDKGVTVVVMALNDLTILESGLPFAYFDLLLLMGTTLMAPDKGPSLQALFWQILALILPACDARIIAVENSGLNIHAFEQMSVARWDKTPLAASSLVSTVVDEIMIRDKQHEKPLQTDGCA
jgi:cyanophycin synthetase